MINNTVTKLRFKNEQGKYYPDWDKRSLNQIAKKVKEKNSGLHLSFVLTNSATRGIVGQKDYFEKNIANKNNLSGYYVVKKDDFVYNPRISVSAPVGPIKRNNLKNGVMSPLYTVFRIKENSNLTFFEYYFESSYWHKYMCSIANYGARHDRMNISSSDFFKLPLPYPCLEEQTKIADFLTSVDKRIQQLKKKKELWEAYKKGVMQRIISQEIRFKDDKGNAYPNWEKKRLDDIFVEITDKVGNRNIENYSISAGKGFVSQKVKFGKSISGEQTVKYTVLTTGDFTYNKGNSKTYNYGCIYLNDIGKDIAVPNVFISFKPKKENLNRWFYQKLFESHYLDRGLRQIISSTARMDGLLNINKGNFFKLTVPFPSHEEQTKIADFAIAIDKKISFVDFQLEQTKMWKKGLLQQMFV